MFTKELQRIAVLLYGNRKNIPLQNKFSNHIKYTNGVESKLHWAKNTIIYQ